MAAEEQGVFQSLEDQLGKAGWCLSDWSKGMGVMA